MIVKKITDGFVIQEFDTELGKFVKQEFIAGDKSDYETVDGEVVESDMLNVNGKEAYLPYEMKQP